ncbi:hypothetical protein LEN26_007404 [Aphanomyces euteiches]|nr:hypothetical protein AeMF1_019009 [Aphanomyces euteiches]KAH9132447.1 hypothetical protein LEN26_007404 [Aphanomyces euteiches]KAH9181481.1 hypothetical protein AeNC1_016542 [Aphanomyces euteiches]
MSSAEEIFKTMDAAVREAGDDLINKVKGTIIYDITDVGRWLIQCKTAPGGVSKVTADVKADLTLSISEPDFLLLAAQKLTPQQAMLQGKLKVKGNVSLAPKIAFIREAVKKKVEGGESAPAPPVAAPTSTLASASIFASIAEAIKSKGPELVNKVKGTIQFNITPGGAWHVNLKSGAGSIEATTKAADVTITVSDSDFMLIADGKLNPQMAFMKGKLKLKGNMALAMKLPVVIEAAKAPRSKL